ncbi:ribosomal protein S16 domain-containing protein [Coprinopsis sp. MPI-PUGE-AT-0042]|nr:ribosomal protein S16 domain-containing protein [Coprinopsis sp. MPI-PUGE-AT-0042]
MPLRIRMSVHGRANYRVFHINVVEGSRKRDAKPHELLGVYDPHVPDGSNTKTIQWSVDRIRYWLSVGALPSQSVVKLLELGGILKPGSPFHATSHKDHQLARQQQTSSSESPILKAVGKAKASRAQPSAA